MNKRQFLERATVITAAAVTSAAAAQPAETNLLIAYHSVSGNTAKMAQAVADGATSVSGIKVVLKKVMDVTVEDLTAADGVIIGSPVYFANVSGEVKMFLDNWGLKFGLMRDFKMRNKVGAAFVTGASMSNGKETTMQAIHAAMLVSQMALVGGGGAFGAGAFGASATTGPDSPGVDEKAVQAAEALGKRVAEVAAVVKRGSKT